MDMIEKKVNTPVIRWGILGAGNIAHRFAASLLQEEGSILQAISVRDPQKGEAFLKTYPAKKMYLQYEELLQDDEIDAVYIALPHGLHKVWAVRAMEAGKAVLLEKPAGMNADEVRKMAEASAKYHVLFMEAMKCRFVPLYGKLQEMLQAGVIGRITRGETSLCNDVPFSDAHPTYHLDPVQGGSLLDVGIYCASWLEPFLKEKPARTRFCCRVSGSVDHYVKGELPLAEGVTGTLECAFDRKKPRNAVLYGEKGRIVIEELHRPQRMTVYKCLEEGGYTEEVIEIPYTVDDFYGEIHHFAACFREGLTESPVMPHAASIRCAEILDELKRGLSCTEEALEVLEKQEEILVYQESFGAKEALALGNSIARLANEYERGVSVKIVREADGMTLFSYACDDKAPRNEGFMERKRNASLACGHSSLYAWAAHAVNGAYDEFFKEDSECLASGGAFPIRVNGERVATVMVSGLHEGLDHELVARGLSDVLKKEVPAYIWRAE